MWPMGISSSTRHGQRWAHIRRRDVAVQAAHGVGPARELQPEHGHAERFVLVLRLDAAQAHQLLERDAQLVAQRAEVLLDQAAVEAVVAGGHGRVRGEDGVLGDVAQGVVEAQAVVLHPLANRFERGERAVAFVQVVDARRDAQRRQRPHAADAGTSSWRMRVRLSPP